jgi:hypothetical protein
MLCPLRADCAAAPVDPDELARLAQEHRPATGPQARLRFEETRRFARGRIIDRLRALPPHEAISLLGLGNELRPVLTDEQHLALPQIVDDLSRDGLIERGDAGLRLA